MIKENMFTYQNNLYLCTDKMNNEIKNTEHKLSRYGSPTLLALSPVPAFFVPYFNTLVQ